MSKPHQLAGCPSWAAQPHRRIAFAAVAWVVPVAGILLVGAPARADIILSGATFSGTNSSGAGPIGFGTTAGIQGYTLFMANGGFTASPSYINTTQQTANLNFDLSAGTYTLSGYMEYGGLVYGATSLFFDGSSNSGVSVWAQQTDSLASVPPYAADGQTLKALTTGNGPGAGTLTYDNGVSTLTVISYVLASQTLITNLGVNQVSTNSTTDGSQNIGFEMTVTVANDASSPIPEPMTMALMLPAIGMVLEVRRRARGYAASSRRVRR